MKIREWLDKEIDIAAAKFDANPDSLLNRIEANQTMLASLTYAVMHIDTRIENIERHLGLDTPEFVSKTLL